MVDSQFIGNSKNTFDNSKGKFDILFSHLDEGSECVDSRVLCGRSGSICIVYALYIYSSTALRASKLGLLVLSGIALVCGETVPVQEPLEILFMLFVRSVNLHSMACKRHSISHY